MDGFRNAQQDLDGKNIKVIAASSDPQDKAGELAAELGLPIGYGVDQALAESLGGYWEPNRKFAQPAEFILNPENKIVHVSYSDGPLARTEAEDVIKLVGFLEKRNQG